MKRNIAKCALCGDIIESTYRHHFVYCKCGEIFIDGGTDYQRGGANELKNILPVTPEEMDAWDAKPTGRLEDWAQIKRYGWDDFPALHGAVYDDKLKRFNDGTYITTSKLPDKKQTFVEGAVIETNYSTYLLGKPRKAE